jgi:hypothetical protein
MGEEQARLPNLNRAKRNKVVFEGVVSVSYARGVAASSSPLGGHRTDETGEHRLRPDGARARNRFCVNLKTFLLLFRQAHYNPNTTLAPAISSSTKKERTVCSIPTSMTVVECPDASPRSNLIEAANQSSTFFD